MKIAHKPTETLEDVAARLRTKYTKHTPEQRERFGDEPSEGTIAGEWIRAQCNDETDEEHYAAAGRAMAIIHGAAAKSHARQPTRSKKASQKSPPSSNATQNTIRFPLGDIVYDDERVADLKVVPIIDTFPKDL